MSEQFAQITTFLREFHNSRGKATAAKIRKVEQQSNHLRELINLEKIAAQQRAVEERMGPQMCDNSQEKQRDQQKAFMIVLANFAKQIEKNSEKQSLQKNQLYGELNEKVEKLSREHQNFEGKNKEILMVLQQDNGELKQKMNEILLQMDSTEEWSDLQAQMRQAQSELELQFVEEQLRRSRIHRHLQKLSEI